MVLPRHEVDSERPDKRNSDILRYSEISETIRQENISLILELGSGAYDVFHQQCLLRITPPKNYFHFHEDNFSPATQ